MKSQKLLLMLIGGWILLVGVDSTNGRMGSIGVRSLRKPFQIAYLVTKTLRTAVLFFLATTTFLLIARQQKSEAGKMVASGKVD